MMTLKQELDDFFIGDEEIPAEETVSISKQLLIDNGVECDLSPWDAGNALLIAEAVNNAAKMIDSGFYSIKGPTVDAAIQLGCAGGWSKDVFYMEYHTAGNASFHDPCGEIHSSGRWSEEWGGIRRQDWAFDIMSNSRIRELFCEATQRGGKYYGAKDRHVVRAANRILAKVTGK